MNFHYSGSQPPSSFLTADQVSRLIEEIYDSNEPSHFEQVMNNFNEVFIARFTTRHPQPPGEFPFGSVARPIPLPRPTLQYSQALYPLEMPMRAKTPTPEYMNIYSVPGPSIPMRRSTSSSRLPQGPSGVLSEAPSFEYSRPSHSKGLESWSDLRREMEFVLH